MWPRAAILFSRFIFVLAWKFIKKNQNFHKNYDTIV